MELEDIVNIVTEIKTQIIEVKTQVGGLVRIQVMDSKAIRQELVSTKELLQTEVHQALNKHGEMKERIMLQDLKIMELEKKEYGCPIKNVFTDVEMLKSETKLVRAIDNNPVIKKGMTVWKAVEIAGILIIAAGVALSLYLNIKNAVG